MPAGPSTCPRLAAPCSSPVRGGLDSGSTLHLSWAPSPQFELSGDMQLPGEPVMGWTPAPSISEVRTRLQGMGQDGMVLPHGSLTLGGMSQCHGDPDNATSPGAGPPGPPGHAWGDFCTQKPSGKQQSRTPCSLGDS